MGTTTPRREQLINKHIRIFEGIKGINDKTTEQTNKKKKRKKKREKSETKVIDVPVSFGLPIIENHVNNP